MIEWTLDVPGQGSRPAERIAFGGPRSGYIITEMPTVDSPEVFSDDSQNARADGLAMGVDYLGGTTVGFAVDTDGTTDADGIDLYEEFRRAWRGDAVRLTPGAVATLTSHHGRRAFGRPRRAARDPRFSHFGRSSITADFKTVDDLWYGDERSARVNLVSGGGGGFVAPFVFPLTSTASSDRRQSIDVGGKVPTPLVVEIHGDIVAPEIEIVGVLRQKFSTVLAYDQSIVIDGRPWRRSILRGGSSVAGDATRDSTSILEFMVPPGRHEFVLRGQSQSGTAYATATWAEAFTSY